MITFWKDLIKNTLLYIISTSIKASNWSIDCELVVDKTEALNH